MCTNVNHSYGVPVGGVPPLLAVPLAGPVKITVKDLAGKLFGETTATPQGEWRQTFCLDDGTYVVEFSGRFRPIGTGFKAVYHKPISSTSVTITVPLVPVPDLPEPVGATGPEGPQGTQGIQGIQGETGSSGPDGPLGVDGADGAQGPSGPAGPAGALGRPGDTGNPGTQGSPGPSGPQGSKGSKGNVGATGPEGVPGDSCEINIGLPADGYLSDGLLDWETTTKVCNALDDVNEILAELAPNQPLSLQGASLSMTGVTMFNGNASDKEYQNYKSAAGESVDGTYIGGAINVADTFTLTNPTVGDPEAGGDDTFYPGDEGTLSSRITADGLENEEGSIDLVTGTPSYDESLTLNAQNAGYNSFNLWVRGDATIDADTYISSGYNKLFMRHNASGSDRDSEEYEVFYDTEPLSQSASVDAVATENTPIYRELSGIRSYTTNSTFNLTVTAINMFNDTYQTDATILDDSVFPGIVDTIIALTDSAWDGTISSIPRFDDTPIVLGGYTDYIFTVTVVNQRATNARAGVTLSKPGRGSVTSQESTTNRLIDTFSDSSTVLDEPFDDEDYRLPDYDGGDYPDNYDTVPGSLTGNWDSTADLIDGEAVVFHGSLYHGSSSSLPSGGDFSSSLPVGPDYSGFTSNAIYLRGFDDDGDPHNSGILELVGLTVADVSPVGSGNVNVEIKLPTETGWLDLGTPFNVALFTGVDGDGCRTAQSSDDWSFTFGTFSTADSDYIIIVRVTIRNTSSMISRMRITDW